MTLDISLCMIARDEEPRIRAALESAAPVCRELLVLDTGSRDRTRDIARECGARVIEEPWCGDFSASRNRIIEEASSGWILILDADEVLVADDEGTLRGAVGPAAAACAETPPEQAGVDAYNLLILNELPSGGVGSLRFPRLFRSDRGCRFEGIVHNQLVVPGRTADLDVRIHHFGYALDPESMRGKYARSVPLLERQIAAQPEDPFPRYNLAIFYQSRGQHRAAALQACTAAQLLERRTGTDSPAAAATADARQLHAAALDLLGLASQGMGRIGVAEHAFRQALERWPGHVDALFDLAHLQELTGRDREARETYEAYFRTLEEGVETTGCLMLRAAHSAPVAWNNLGAVNRRLGDIEGAKQCFERAIAERPQLAPAWSNLANLEATRGNLTRAEELFARAVELRGESAELRAKLATVRAAIAARIHRAGVEAPSSSPLESSPHASCAEVSPLDPSRESPATTLDESS